MSVRIVSGGNSRLDTILAAAPETEGSLFADGTEQIVVQSELGVQHRIEGFIDLSNLISGDTVIIRVYISLRSPVNYVKYAEQTYSNAQNTPLLFIATKTVSYGIKITLEQTAGTNRDFDYQFFTRREE